MIDSEKVKLLRAVPAGDGSVALTRTAITEICDTIEALLKENEELKLHKKFKESKNPWLVDRLVKLETIAATINELRKALAAVPKLDE